MLEGARFEKCVFAVKEHLTLEERCGLRGAEGDLVYYQAAA